MQITTTLSLASLVLLAAAFIGPVATGEATSPLPLGQEIPTEIGGIELGEPLEADVDSHLFDVPALGFKGNVSAIVSGPGVVTHLIVVPQTVEGDPDGDRPLDPDDFDRIVDVLESAYGPATIDGDSWDRAAVWQAADRRLTAERIDPGEMPQVRITLRTEDPTRICGPEDGITEWIDGLTYAVVDGNAEAAAQYFQFPFADYHARVLSGAYEGGELDDSALEFESAEDFIERFPELYFQGAFDEIIGAQSSECDPLTGHIIWLDHLPMQIRWVNGDLYAVAITYFP